MSHFEIDIMVNDNRWHEVAKNIETQTADIIKHMLKDRLPIFEHIEVSVVLVDNAFIQGLNKTYRHKDKPTNVLSFPQTEPSTLDIRQPFVSLGDIIIAYETIEQEAIEQNKNFIDHYTHMLVHGCLHLLHFDHQNDEEAKTMENLEIHYLQDMGIKNPYERQ